MLAGIDVEDLDALLSFLAPLDFGGEREASSEVTLKGWPSLQQHSLPDEDDSPLVTPMKATLQDELQLMELISTVEKSKKLVKYLKQSDLGHRLSKSVKQEIEVRWNSVATLLKSIDDVWDEVRTYFVEILILAPFPFPHPSPTVSASFGPPL